MKNPTEDSGEESRSSSHTKDWDYEVYMDFGKYTDSGSVDTTDFKDMTGDVGGHAARRMEQREVVERLFHCIVDRAAKLNRTVLEDARSDTDELLKMHRKLSGHGHLSDEDKSRVREMFKKWKEM